ncbi:hypothetical protein Ahy_A03g016997 isoform A [Arachis hypogaea]|uniref:Uncharacterized protein n=1 Tax=Arachis hypogaea TaxID=3818 RepID=A0A445E4Z0_ARAHY|nr:hypothetical protein Ahy_A03g016997 isoform A [Arachis hypogaea]
MMMKMVALPLLSPVSSASSPLPSPSPLPSRVPEIPILAISTFQNIHPSHRKRHTRTKL